MNLRYPVVVLFGAGATRGALKEAADPPPPIDIDFFDIAAQIKPDKIHSLAIKVRNAVWKLYGQTHDIGLEYYFRDIDTRKEFQDFAKPGHNPYRWERDKNNLIELIRRIYIYTALNHTGKLEPFCSNLHKHIIQLLKPNDSIITFNYDLLIEESFPNTRFWKPHDGYGISVSGAGHKWCKDWIKSHHEGPLTNKSEILLLKLHGSINWERYPGTNRIRMRHYPYKLYKSPPRDKIAIMAPQWKKRVELYPYNEIWNKTVAALETCNSLIIIGYSLPETDLMAHALLQEAKRRRLSKPATKKKYLNQLHLADPNKSVRNRYINLFQPVLSPRASVMEYDSIEEFAIKHTAYKKGEPFVKQLQ